MIRKVRKAVFPAAGLGTRFLPATKAQPKEMLSLVDKPLIQYGVEEAMHSGIQNMIIVTGRGKTAIEDHFDVSFELEHLLEERGDVEMLRRIRHISDLAQVAYVRQKEQLGLGHAVLMAKERATSIRYLVEEANKRKVYDAAKRSPKEWDAEELDEIARVRLAGEEHEGGPGAVYVMPAGLPHAVTAREACVFLLTMVLTGSPPRP